MNFEIEEIQYRCNAILKVLGLFQLLVKIAHDSLQSDFSLSRIPLLLKDGCIKITVMCCWMGFCFGVFLISLLCS